jgi:hypothetical protein
MAMGLMDECAAPLVSSKLNKQQGNGLPLPRGAPCSQSGPQVWRLHPLEGADAYQKALDRLLRDLRVEKA